MHLPCASERRPRTLHQFTRVGALAEHHVDEDGTLPIRATLKELLNAGLPLPEPRIVCLTNAVVLLNHCTLVTVERNPHISREDLVYEPKSWPTGGRIVMEFADPALTVQHGRIGLSPLGVRLLHYIEDAWRDEAASAPTLLN